MQEEKNKVVLTIQGMDCSNCALGIKRALNRMQLLSVDVNFAASEVSFAFRSEEEIEKAIKKIESLGYSIVSNSYDENKTYSKKVFSIEIKFIISLVFTVPLLLTMALPVEILHNPWVQLLIAIPVMTVGVMHFGKSAFNSLKTGIPNMDVLIILGSSAAFIYSLVGTINKLGHDYQFYETSASIITLILFGNLLEQRAIKKTTSAIDELVRLQKITAKKITIDPESGHEKIEELDALKLRNGDMVLVNSGEKIPADGEITWGEAEIDESMISGESIPVLKKAGDQIIGGTMAVSGCFKSKITATGKQSYLSRIIDMVKKAQQDKPELQNLADKISTVFVPAVVLISVSTFAITYGFFDVPFIHAFLRGTAVLVIACPCALGLAIPTAIVVAVGKAARKGILVKGASTFQKMAVIKKIIFDKTGTLTTGTFRLKEIIVYSGNNEEIISIIAGLEKFSSHPIARSLLHEIKPKNITEFSDIHEVKGRGIFGKDKEGNEFSIVSFHEVQNITTKKHNLYLLKNRDLIAGIDIEDELRPEAKTSVLELQMQNINSVLLSGDRLDRCNEAAKKLGISEIYAEKLPEEKLGVIEKLSASGEVAMVGDGINDAPALAKASVGISLGSATDAAIQSAQVILVSANLLLLPRVVSLSRKTVSVIKQNLFWAFFYNVLAIPLAAAGYLNPMVAAACMAMSDVIVVLNSLRLRLDRSK